jgi:hypothetical protein
MSREEIALEKVLDNGRSAPRNHVSRDRSIYLHFEQLHSGATTVYSVTAIGDVLLRYHDIGGGLFFGKLTVDETSLYSAIGQMQELWRDRVVGRRERKVTGDVVLPGEKVPKSDTWFPFAENWDLSWNRDSETRLQAVARPLAKAGYKLFRLLFYGGDARLKRIGDALTGALREGKQLISIQSDSLYVPWWMLYTPPAGQEDLSGDDDQPVSWKGFWGYSHIIEHNFENTAPWEPCISVGQQGIIAGVNVDRKLDKQYPETPCVAPMITLFESIAGNTIVRETKRILDRDIRSPYYRDHVMYFGCHGTGVSDATGPAHAHISLTDGEWIDRNDFRVWLDETPLCTSPIVFVNACQGGQMSSLFYTAFGIELIARGVNCLIGPQVDIPPVVAYEYASAFFAELATGNGNAFGNRVGDVFQQLAVEGLTERKNPLGLIMSLYRGIDSHFCYMKRTDLPTDDTFNFR